MPRKGNIKVRTGCMVCKIRKVKCDETKPSCLRCTSTGRKCEGYLQQQQSAGGLLRVNLNRTFQGVTTQGLGRALEHYGHVVGPALSGSQDQYFWTSLVLQFANFEPAVRHSLAAISLLYEHLDPMHCGREITAQEQYASIMHYNAAIRELKATNVLEKQPVILLVCVLFVCIEMLQQDRQGAVRHCKHGFALLANCSAYNYPWAKQYLEPVFRRLAVFPFFFGRCDSDYPNLSQLSGPSDNSLESFSDARHLIDRIFGQALRVYCLGDEYRIGRFRHCPVPEGLLRDQAEVNSLLDNWYSMFSTLAGQLPTGLAASTANEPNLLMSREFLLARSYVCRIAANMAFEKEETGYDQYSGLFQEVCRNLDRIADYVVASVPAGELVDIGRTKFTFEMGFMPTICFCILKCRHLETRLRFWRLLPILSKSQESLWQLNSMIMADQRLIELEHGLRLDSMKEDMSIYPSELPPDESRIRRMWVAPMPTHRIMNGQHVVGRMVGFTKVNQNCNPIYETQFIAAHSLQ
ncbi:hypothetical protein NW762_011547 [Fusarium torreyae]|uniref:Zn(2)-C6 fungal-type domain-containing protein n=1 Tax=Fusarium torreyae TaxID=1237075 RepID=A0A9W8RRU5_9HYPO|nr:hypothetical protein NW762_011547 [Fusarium torreyae]